MAFYLAIKEMLRNKLRFLMVVLIVGLVTLLVLFLVAMSEGLTLSSSEYIESIDAELFLFRDKANRSIGVSSMGRSKLNDINRVGGVEAVGPIGFSTATIVFKRDGVEEKIDVTLVGVEPGKPGAPGSVPNFGRRLGGAGVSPRIPPWFVHKFLKFGTHPVRR
jgi:putative ABC transport system permease protein